MATFIENLIDNEFPVTGFKPFIKSQELLRGYEQPKKPNSVFKPMYRGVFSKNWRHGNTLRDSGQNFAVELGDRIKFGQFSLKNQFMVQSGPNLNYRVSLGFDFKDFGELEVSHQARNVKTVDFYQITHYTSKNGMNTKANLVFQEPHFRPILTLSSLYNQTIEIFDRKTMKLNKRVATYGIDTSFSFAPLQQLHYSLYYQTKCSNYSLIAAYMRKSMGEKLFNNQIVAGIKYRAQDQKKLLAKVSYNIEDKFPQLDLMIRKRHDQNRTLKTFHKLSTNFKIGSGFTLNLKNIKLHGLAEVNLLNSDFNSQPFNLSFRIETSEEKKPVPQTTKAK